MSSRNKVVMCLALLLAWRVRLDDAGLGGGQPR